MYLRTKFEVSSLILTSFRQGAGGSFTPPYQNKPLKSPPRLGLKQKSIIPLKESIIIAKEVLFSLKESLMSL